MKRSRLRPVSAKMAQRRADAADVRRAYLTAHPFCEAAKGGAPGVCFGELHVHEVVPRARGGDIADVTIFRAVCDHHNTAISQDVATMRWAYANDFLRHS